MIYGGRGATTDLSTGFLQPFDLRLSAGGIFEDLRATGWLARLDQPRRRGQPLTDRVGRQPVTVLDSLMAIEVCSTVPPA